MEKKGKKGGTHLVTALATSNLGAADRVDWEDGEDCSAVSSDQRPAVRNGSGKHSRSMATHSMPSWMGMRPPSSCFWTELQHSSFRLLPHFWEASWAGVPQVRSSTMGLAMAAAAKAATARMENCMLNLVGVFGLEIRKIVRVFVGSVVGLEDWLMAG